VADTGNGRVIRFKADSGVESGPVKPAQFWREPYDLGYNRWTGTIWQTVTAAGGMVAPSGLALSADGQRLFVSDASTQDIVAFAVDAPPTDAELAGLTGDLEGQVTAVNPFEEIVSAHPTTNIHIHTYARGPPPAAAAAAAAAADAAAAAAAAAAANMPRCQWHIMSCTYLLAATAVSVSVSGTYGTCIRIHYVLYRRVGFIPQRHRSRVLLTILSAHGYSIQMQSPIVSSSSTRTAQALVCPLMLRYAL
jgi:hypothetical protein